MIAALLLPLPLALASGTASDDPLCSRSGSGALVLAAGESLPDFDGLFAYRENLGYRERPVLEISGGRPPFDFSVRVPRRV